MPLILECATYGVASLSPIIGYAPIPLSLAVGDDDASHTSKRQKLREPQLPLDPAMKDKLARKANQFILHRPRNIFYQTSSPHLLGISLNVYRVMCQYDALFSNC